MDPETPCKTPVIAHMKTKANVQNPITLCRSQLNRFQLVFHRSSRPRRRPLIPGHQMTMPVKHMTARMAPPTPLISRPTLSPRRLS